MWSAAVLSSITSSSNIAKQRQTIDNLNQSIAWLKRKVWGQSSEKRHTTDDPEQLTIDFDELKITPEEEAAYKKAQEELNAYHELRKAEAAKRHARNRPSRNPLPESLRRERIDVYPEGYNEQDWELLPDSFNETKVVLHRKPAEYFVAEYILHKAVRRDDIERTIKSAATPQTPVAIEKDGKENRKRANSRFE